MGRPLNKKYFGNRNIGSTSTSDDYGIGGEGVASAAVSVAGSYTTTLPTITFSAPQLPSGVTAAGSIISKVISATISGGTGYGNAQTFDLTVTTAGGSCVLNVTSDAGGAVVTVNSVTTAGSFTELSAVTSVSGGTGTGAVPVLTYGALSVTITEKGSGYSSAPTVSYTNRGGITVNNITLTTDSGSVGSSTNQENAIQITAWIPASGAAGYISGAGGSSAVTGDIMRQVGSKKYVVKTAQGVGRVTLVADTIAAGQATIIATDANGNTYYVTKLTAHKATLTRLTDDSSDGDWLFATGAVAQWSFDAASGLIVQIANA